MSAVVVGRTAAAAFPEEEILPVSGRNDARLGWPPAAPWPGLPAASLSDGRTTTSLRCLWRVRGPDRIEVTSLRDERRRKLLKWLMNITNISIAPPALHVSPDLAVTRVLNP